jgi:hypothetical protein
MSTATKPIANMTDPDERVRAEVGRMIDAGISREGIAAALLAWGCSMTFAIGGQTLLIDTLAEDISAAARMI